MNKVLLFENMKRESKKFFAISLFSFICGVYWTWTDIENGIFYGEKHSLLLVLGFFIASIGYFFLFITRFKYELMITEKEITVKKLLQTVKIPLETIRTFSYKPASSIFYIFSIENGQKVLFITKFPIEVEKIINDALAGK